MIPVEAIKCKFCSCVIPKENSIPDVLMAARVLLNKQRFVQAENLLTTALSKEANNPSKVRILDELARSYVGQGNREGAEKSFKTALSLCKEKGSRISPQTAKNIRTSYIAFLEQSGQKDRANKLKQEDSEKAVLKIIACVVGLAVAAGLVIFLLTVLKH